MTKIKLFKYVFVVDKKSFDNTAYIIIYDEYMHISDSKIKLFKEFFLEYKSDKHLAM